MDFFILRIVGRFSSYSPISSCDRQHGRVGTHKKIR
jgi:hypothetical protein